MSEMSGCPVMSEGSSHNLLAGMLREGRKKTAAYSNFLWRNLLASPRPSAAPNFRISEPAKALEKHGSRLKQPVCNQLQRI